MNSNGDCLSEAAFHQLDSKIEMFVLPDIVMICTFNVFAEINYRIEYLERDSF